MSRAGSGGGLCERLVLVSVRLAGCWKGGEGRPGDVLVVEAAMAQAAVEDADEPIADGTKRLVMGGAPCTVGTVGTLGTRRGRQGREGPEVAGRLKPGVGGAT